MTGSEIKKLREACGLTVLQWGRALGYTGNDNTVNVAVRRYEGGQRPIPPWIERLATMYARHGVPPEYLNASSDGV